MTSLRFRRLIGGSLAFAFSVRIVPVRDRPFPERSPHGLLIHAASGDLRSGPATRSRGTYPHLSRSSAFQGDPESRPFLPSWRTVIRIADQVDFASRTPTAC